MKRDQIIRDIQRVHARIQNGIHVIENEAEFFQHHLKDQLKQQVKTAALMFAGMMTFSWIWKFKKLKKAILPIKPRSKGLLFQTIALELLHQLVVKFLKRKNNQ